jgi:hypothetical protein
LATVLAFFPKYWAIFLNAVYLLKATKNVTDYARK